MSWQGLDWQGRIDSQGNPVEARRRLPGAAGSRRSSAAGSEAALHRSSVTSDVDAQRRTSEDGLARSDRVSFSNLSNGVGLGS